MIAEEKKIWKIREQLEDLTEENLFEKRVDVAKLFLDHNRQGKIFSKKEITAIPFEGITQLLAEISTMRKKEDKDQT